MKIPNYNCSKSTKGLDLAKKKKLNVDFFPSNTKGTLPISCSRARNIKDFLE